MNLKLFKKSEDTENSPNAQYIDAMQAWIDDEPLLDDKYATPNIRLATKLTAEPSSVVLPLSQPLTQDRSRAYLNSYRPSARSTLGSTMTSHTLSNTTDALPKPLVDTPPTISVQIHIPTFRVPQPLIQCVPRVLKTILRSVQLLRIYIRKCYGLIKLQRVLICQLVCVAGLVCTVLVIYSTHVNQRHTPNVLGTAAAVKVVKPADAAVAQPQFRIVTPKTKPQLATINPGVSTYDAKRNSYSYTDDFQDRTILVSEQPLPTNFKSESDAVLKIAQQIGAKEAMATSRGTAYLGTDSKSGQQTVVLSRNGVLIFIQSPFSYTALKWQPYLEALQQS